VPDIKLIIGNKNYSSWSLRAWLYLKYFNIPFSEIRIPLDTSKTKSEILKYAPAGKVPILIDDDLVVSDSIAILEYLAEKYPNNNSWPLHIKTRALARSICAEMHSGFSYLRNEMPMDCRTIYKEFTPSIKIIQDINRVREIWSNCLKENNKNGPWLYGNFTIADCMYAPVVFRFISYCIELSPIEHKYVKELVNHPAMIEWLNAAKAEPETIDLF
jgi:glutathione S-transferase